MACNRYGKKWTVNEVNQLQREYELLSMSIPEIALKHQRDVKGIAYKLFKEGLVTSLPDLVHRNVVIDLTTRSSRRMQPKIEKIEEINLVSDVSISSEMEVFRLKSDIVELKKMVSELSSLIKSSYDGKKSRASCYL